VCEEMLSELVPLHAEIRAVTSREFVLSRGSLSYHSIKGSVSQIGDT